MKKLLILSCLALPACTYQPQPQQPQQSLFSSRNTGEIGDGPTSGNTAIITDAETGCEYIITAWRELGVTPRLRRDGTPACPDAPPAREEAAR